MIHAGIDIGGTTVKVGLIDGSGESPAIIMKLFFDTPRGEFQKLCSMTATAVEELLSNYSLDKSDLASIGIALPGSIDTSGRVLKNAFNLQMFDVPFADEMSKYFPETRILLANDANAAALAELYAGAFKGYKNAILLTLGTGLGGGIILGGKLFNGGRNHGTEPGHLPFKKDSDPCTCGLSGCMEVYTAASWLAKQGKERLGPEYAGAKYVTDEVHKGNRIAIDIFNTYVDNLATAVGGLCSLFDPEIIALGGGLSAAGDILYEPLKKFVKDRNFFREEYDIVPAQLGNDAGIIGAAMLCSNAQND